MEGMSMDRRRSQAAAERIQRSALRKMTVFAIAFLVWQISYFGFFRDTGDSVRAVDIVRTAGFLAWSLALLVLFATGGGALSPRHVRQFLDDELARARRAASYRNGFWTMIATCFLAYVATMVVELRAVDLAHLTLSSGVLSVLVSQVVLDRR